MLPKRLISQSLEGSWRKSGKEELVCFFTLCKQHKIRPRKDKRISKLERKEKLIVHVYLLAFPTFFPPLSNRVGFLEGGDSLLHIQFGEVVEVLASILSEQIVATYNFFTPSSQTLDDYLHCKQGDPCLPVTCDSL